MKVGKRDLGQPADRCGLSRFRPGTEQIPTASPAILRVLNSSDQTRPTPNPYKPRPAVQSPAAELSWSKDAVGVEVWRGEAFCLLSADVFLGGGGSYSSFAAGFISGRWMLLQIHRRRQSGEEKKRSREWPFGVSEFEVGGGVTPATFRDGGGQVEAEETRGVLMGSYPFMRLAFLTRGRTEVGRVGIGLRPVKFVLVAH
ncbi:hypothetical protein HID58_029026 [Brassica napus]|uniref:Uncharacterized protein n=1 Tax=Brassica napus TaxID=3708 RepID=A0ABQ8CC09_BRANA|nr:hypothetical protein HID58_029026 [Brassica napus]